MTLIYEERNEKDEKAMSKLMKSILPQFSNEHDWEMAAFELALALDRIWPHKQELNITDYMSTTHTHYDRDMERRADSLIYFALTLAAKKDSYAKLQIMATCHPDAVPCVLRNEGKRLFQMFQSLFTMTSLHTANLPSMRQQFHDIAQRDKETVLQYTARVDIIVATMAKLGEQVSPGAWIYALGHGLRSEFTDTKEGILYSKSGYDTVLSVKSKMMSEAAILKDKKASTTKAQLSHKDTMSVDEIALKVDASNPKSPLQPKSVTFDISQFNKGKDGKKGGQCGQRQWNDRSYNEASWASGSNWQLPPDPWSTP